MISGKRQCRRDCEIYILALLATWAECHLLPLYCGGRADVSIGKTRHLTPTSSRRINWIDVGGKKENLWGFISSLC